MDKSDLTILGIVVGVALLFLGSRIRARSHRRRPPQQDGGTGGGDR